MRTVLVGHFLFISFSKSETWFSVFQYAAIEKHSAKECIQRKVFR